MSSFRILDDDLGRLQIKVVEMASHKNQKPKKLRLWDFPLHGNHIHISILCFEKISKDLPDIKSANPLLRHSGFERNFLFSVLTKFTIHFLVFVGKYGIIY